MTTQTDNFASSATPSQKVISASPQREAIERALRPKLKDKLDSFDPKLNGSEIPDGAPVGSEFGAKVI